MTPPISRRAFVSGTAGASLAAGLQSLLPAALAEPSHLRCGVLVCAATPAGIAAAVTAARHGRSVLLVEYEDHIGGILSNGLTNTDLDGAHRSAVGGFFAEFTARIVAHYTRLDSGSLTKPNLRLCRGGFAYEPSVCEAIFQQFVAEQSAHLRVLFRHELKHAVTDGNRLTAAVFEDRDHPGHFVHIAAGAFIDATYEGDLAAFARADFRLGRESRADLNEPHAGVIYMRFGSVDPQPGSTGQGDKAIQSYCFRFSATANPANRVPVEKPLRYNRADYATLLDDFRSGNLTRLNQVFGVFPMPCGKVEFNSQNPAPDTGLPSESLDLAEACWPWPLAAPAQRRRIYERYLSHNVGMLWFLQNDPAVPAPLQADARRYGWCRDEFVRNRHLPRQVYVREGRRIEGVYLLTEHDGDLAPGWARARVQPTSIGLVEWPYDSHACHRYDPAHPGAREGYTFVPHAIFQIPYGVVVPRSVDGLLVPVACSASHVAYNALRMEPVFMALGEACGHAAHLALQANVPLRSVPVAALQEHLLANRGVITYFDDLDPASESFAAFQWLGARGFNDGYHANPDELLTRADAAKRLTRVLQCMQRTWTPPPGDAAPTPVGSAQVTQWLTQAGFPPPAPPSPPVDSPLTAARLALLVYAALRSA